MNSTPQTSGLRSWEKLRDALTNSFSVRATGLLAREFVVEKGGVELGRLRIEGLRGAGFTAVGLKARIERMPGNEYRMFSEGKQILSAGPRASSADVLEMFCADEIYTSRVSFLRNTAIVRDPAGGETLSLKGNVSGRKYEVKTSGNVAAVPVFVLLLYHTAALRRRVYQA